MIASYLRDHWHNLAFETGASIASALELSEMTVIRFIRQLGFTNLKDFKEALKTADTPDAANAPQMARGSNLPSLANEAMERRLQDEIKALSDAYRLTALPRWTISTSLLAESEFVSICGFQSTRGLALDCATRLQYVRPQVRYMDDHSSLCTEVLDMVGRSHCLLMVNSFPYARKGILLAEKAKQLGIPLIILTDQSSSWAYDHTEMVLQAAANLDDPESASAALAVIVNLLIASVAKRIGQPAQDRSTTMAQVETHFDEIRRSPSPSPRSSTPRRSGNSARSSPANSAPSSKSSRSTSSTSATRPPRPAR